MKEFIKNFLLCGFIGWCNECFWTGLRAVQVHRDRTLLCRTSVWMFPIYGMAAVIPYVHKKLQGVHVFFRGCVYMLGIFTMEFLTGSLLQCFRCCPWDYGSSRWHVRKVIRLDYAPVWFGLGLFYEWILCKKGEKQDGKETGERRTV